MFYLLDFLKSVYDASGNCFKAVHANRFSSVFQSLEKQRLSFYECISSNIYKSAISFIFFLEDFAGFAGPTLTILHNPIWRQMCWNKLLQKHYGCVWRLYALCLVESLMKMHVDSYWMRTCWSVVGNEEGEVRFQEMVAYSLFYLWPLSGTRDDFNILVCCWESI